MFRRKSVLYTWCLSYGAILIFMIVMGITMEITMRRQLINEYKDITQSLQQQTNAAVNSYFDNLDQCAFEFGNDYLTNNFLAAAVPDGSDYYSLSPIQQSLMVYSLQSNGSVSHYLYMNNIDRALSNNAIYPQDELYDLLNLSAAMDEQAFTALLNQQHYHQLLAYGTPEGRSQVLMLTSIPLISTRPKGTFIQVIAPETLDNMIRSNAVVDNSTVVLLDESNGLLSQAGDPQVAGAVQSADLSTIHNSEITLDGESFWIECKLLDRGGWKLLTVVPMKAISAKSDTVIHRMLLIMLVTLGVTTALCMGFLYLNYTPLNQLLKQLTGNGGGIDASNEYDQLAEAFQDIRSSREQISALWESQSSQLQQEFIRSCIEENIVCNEETLYQMMDHLDLGLRGHWFCVAILDAGESAIHQGNQVWESLLERDEQVAASVVSFYLFPRNQQQILLLNAEDRLILMEALDRLERAFSQQAQVLGWQLLMTHSSPRQDFFNIHLAYLEANEQWRYQIDRISKEYALEGGSAEAGPDSVAVPHLSNEQEALLLRYILAGNADEADATLKLILHHNLEKQVLPVSMFRCLAYHILYGVYVGISNQPNLWREQKEAIRLDLHALRHESSQRGIADILKQTVRRTALACGEKTMPSGRAKPQPIERVVECVNQHYREPDFNVSKAAEYLQVSVPYLSNLFKQQMGIGLLSYISGMRVKYAKKCILEDNLSVAQAAKEAGFENINTFIRTFKKYEGTTPGRIVF